MKKNRLWVTLSTAALTVSMMGGVVSQAANKDMMHHDHMPMTAMHHHTKKYMHMASMDMHHAKKGMTMDGMNMNSKLPKGLVKAKHAKYKVGQAVTIKAHHMPGMYNAKGKVVGAYQTKLYEIDYTATNNGRKVKNHKWVIAKELKAQGKLTTGKHVIVLADHMVGMKGAKGKIVKVHRGPAYAVTYTDKKTHKVVKNHKWLVQSELKVR
jgi:uncharacterized protein involved in copper resistance